MDIDLTIMDFKNHLRTVGYAQSTVACYCQYLGYFLAYLQDRDVTDLKK